MTARYLALVHHMLRLHSHVPLSRFNEPQSGGLLYMCCILRSKGSVSEYHGRHLCMNTTGQDLTTVKRGEFSQLTPWHSPETYDLIIKAAQDGAQAIVNSPEGHFMRTVNDVIIRVDVVLGAQWLSNDEVLLHPMVNEMDWLNSAGMLATFWKEPILSSENAEQQGRIIADTLKRSAGYKIAHTLMSEVTRVHNAKDKPL